MDLHRVVLGDSIERNDAINCVIRSDDVTLENNAYIQRQGGLCHLRRQMNLLENVRGSLWVHYAGVTKQPSKGEHLERHVDCNRICRH